MSDNGTAAPLRFEILGDLRAFRGGDRVDLGPAKQRAVLAVLLLHSGRPVPIPQIIDAVWGDGPPENGPNVVQKYVAGLRRVLDTDRALLTLTSAGYALRAEGALDADEFRAAVTRSDAERRAGQLLEAATSLRVGLALWRGEALAGLTGPVFDAARARLADERATAWENWADIGLATGRAAVLLPELGRLIGEFPLREGLRAQLMIALHQIGRQAEALAAFRDARAYFLDQLGAEPGHRMQEAHRRLLRGEPIAPPLPEQPPAVEPAPQLMSPQFPRPRRMISLLEVFFAVIAPVATCGSGSWVYFMHTALRRRQPRHLIAAATYFLVYAIGAGGFFSAVDAGTEDDGWVPKIGFAMMALVPLAAAVHGLVLAIRSGDGAQLWTRREQARQLAVFAPDRARELGIGRPDLAMRLVDDGGLIDLNHVGGYDLARAAGLPLAQAFGIVTDRVARGPFVRPEDLVLRGLTNERTVRRLASRLICVPAGPAPAAWPPG